MAPIGAIPARTALRVTAGPAVGHLILIDDELTLGSSQTGAGALGGDASLSAAHAALTRDHSGEWMVRDLGSAEGTFLNGQPLTGAEPLHRGDTLRLGASKLIVVEGSARRPRGGVSVPVPPMAPPVVGAPPAAEAPEEQPPAQEPAPALPSPPRPQDRITSYRKRGLANTIDGVILTGILFAVVLALGGKLFSGLVALAIMLSWDFLFESLRGQTIGKRAMKIRVVRRDGSRLRPQHVAARSVLRLIDGQPLGLPLIGLLSMIFSGPKRRQRLGDLAAGTIVVDSGRAMSKLPPSTRDRFVLAGYPVLWLAPVLIWALATPGATTRICREGDALSLRPSEGTCLAKLPDGQTGAITSVNPGHTLHWQGYDISLLAARARAVRRTSGLGTLVGYKLSVTNTGKAPAAFDRHAVRVSLLIPAGGQAVREAVDLPDSLAMRGFRPIATMRPVAPGATRIGWVRFLVPSGAVSQLNDTLASLAFEPLVPPSTGLPAWGDIRLWSPATSRGAAAIHVRHT